MVGEDEDIVDVAAAALLVEPLESLDGVGLVARGIGMVRRACSVAEEFAVVRLLEARQQFDLVAAGRREDGAVLGAGDVPLQALEDQHAFVVGAGLEYLLVLQLGAVEGVPEVAVFREDHPVQAVCCACGSQLGERVLRVVAVDGVVVVVADQVDEVGIVAADPGRRQGVCLSGRQQ